MPDPTTPIAIAATAGVASLLPFVNGDALFGAVIGAAFIAFYTQNVSYKKRISTFLLSTAMGYLLEPELVNRTPIDSHSTAAFAIALVAIIILQKIIAWLESASLQDIWNTVRGKPTDPTDEKKE
ncbi:hypothetical protein I2F27_11115 [Acinetobacter sp. B5B]|uniref:putative holin n=1 Tax=Acinetobacter baretiae TaxID=2605383 RepID=UPI0018C29862|nr:putative holin [Acinetobacter baretiae]MBF7683868.1 hypothetical protein [Acinetobacter baretiae]